jgi:hypothetical protein
MRVAMCVNRTANRRILAVTMPDLSPLGGSLPKESGYEWDVLTTQ